MNLLAPHLVYPPRHGADLYVERLARHVSQVRGQSLLLGSRELLTYCEGQLVSQQPYANEFRSKSVAALRVLIRQSNYYVEKFLTPAFSARAAQMLGQFPDSVVVCSYLATASLLPGLAWDGPSITLTHNDEVAWFLHQVHSFANPLQKAVAWSSARWVKRFLRQHSAKLTLAHIAEADHAAYDAYLPGHPFLLVPAGVDVAPLAPLPVPDGKIRLVFAGSLSTRMNYDALRFFSDHFWDLLHTHLPSMTMTVLGSAPSPSVRTLCRTAGWDLIPDLPDAEFKAALSRADFSVLPFSYTTGAKLKLLTSLAVGVPVLATTNMDILPGQRFPPNFYADTPDAWLAHLRQFSAQGPDHAARQACHQYALRYSWESIARTMVADYQRQTQQSQ